MANTTTVAQWQQAKSTLVTQSNQNLATFAVLKREGAQLAFQSADLNKQLKTATDPVQRAQLQQQFDSVQSQLQQNSNKIDQNQAEQERLGSQIETANDEIEKASSGISNTNSTTSPANNAPGSNTQAEPLAPVVAPAVQYSVPPQLRTVVSPIGAGEFSYDVIDTERGKIIRSFDSQSEADAYMASQGSAPGSTPATPNQQVQNTAPAAVTGPTGTPYDDEGNLNPGWSLDEDNNPVWVGAGYNDATGQTAPSIQEQKTIPNNSIQGTPYDDEGNLNPGWALDEDNNPVWVGGDYVEPATQASANESRAAAQGLTGPKTNTQSQATQQDTANFYQTGDWRVRLSLAPSADYLYKAKGNEGILLPLAATNGVIFPYTPSIAVNYSANYDPSDITHSNFKTFQYKSSSVDSITISCDFTAQDTFEANYLLAVIHFFRSVTKMFYGQDENPKNGTPPPLCYLTGLGAFQFDRHPLAITAFNYSLPTDVDYIRATNTTTTGGVNKSAGSTPINTTDVSSQRLGGLPTGGGSGPVNWQNTNSGSREPTYVPTKMQISISAIPIVTRNDISRNFSLKDYATGNLLRGSKRQQGGGGIW